MMFNGDKFESIKHGENINLKNSYNYINSESEEIEDVNNLRDLGIIISDDGSFRDQIIKVVKKARRLCGWIDRSFIRNDIYWRRHMLHTYVLPVIDYGSQIWSPTNQALLNELESIQRTYTCNTDGLDTFNYWDRLKHMNIQSIQRRHERYKILYIWKIMNGLVPQCNLNWTDNHRRGKMVTIPGIRTKHCTTAKNMRESSLAVHGGGIFNLLPANIRNFTGSLNNFKTILDTFLASIPDKPAINGMYPNPISRSTARNSNSISDWILHLGLRDRRLIVNDDILS